MLRSCLLLLLACSTDPPAVGRSQWAIVDPPPGRTGTCWLLEVTIDGRVWHPGGVFCELEEQ